MLLDNMVLYLKYACITGPRWKGCLVKYISNSSIQWIMSYVITTDPWPWFSGTLQTTFLTFVLGEAEHVFNGKAKWNSVKYFRLYSTDRSSGTFTLLVNGRNRKMFVKGFWIIKENELGSVLYLFSHVPKHRWKRFIHICVVGFLE